MTARPARDVSHAALPWFARVVRAFVRRELAAATSYRAATFTRLVGFATVLTSLLFFARFVGAAANPHLQAFGGNYLGFAAVGLLTAGFQQVGVSALANRIRLAQVMGTLEAELASPAPAWMVLGAAPIYEFGWAAARAVAYLWVASALVDLRLSRVSLGALALAVPLVLAAFVGLGLVAAATTMLVRRTNPVALLLGWLSFLLSGVAYPVAVLPRPLQLAGQALPLTHALRVLRGALLAGASPAALRGPLTALAVFAVVLIPAGVGTFAYALRRARIDGSLSHY